MAQITLQLPDELAERLAPYRDRLPELLERGLHDILKGMSTAEEDAELEGYLRIEHWVRMAKAMTTNN